DAILNLAAYGGSTVALRLITNPGASNNPSCDWALWSQVAMNAPPPSPISIPLSLASGSVAAGFDGDGVLSSGSSLTPTVSGVALPGSFTVFTQTGPAVSSGTNLAGVAFDVWGGSHGELAVPGGIFGAGSVGNTTAGGVQKTQTIWAHPRNDGI